MEAIILAGGMGDRLRKVIADRPKPMAPIGGKPFLYYLVSYLGQYNIERIILSVGYKYEIIQAYFGNRFANLIIDYAVEDEPLGTGGAIRRALDQVSGKTVLILNGDTFFAVNFNELAEEHAVSGAMLAMALKPFDNRAGVHRYGNVETDGPRIIGFTEKKPGFSGYINTGIYIINTQDFIQLNLSGKFSFEKDFLEKYVSRLHFHACLANAYFIDIGVPEDYYIAKKELPEKVRES